MFPKKLTSVFLGFKRVLVAVKEGSGGQRTHERKHRSINTLCVWPTKVGHRGEACRKRWFYTKARRKLHWNYILEGERESCFVFLQTVRALFGIEMRLFIEQSLEEELCVYYLKNWGNFWTFPAITPKAQPLSPSCMKPQQSAPWIATHYGNASSYIMTVIIHQFLVSFVWLL